MALITIKSNRTVRSGKELRLFFRVTHLKVARRISIPFKVFPEEWDDVNHRIIFPTGIGTDRRQYLEYVRNSIEAESRRLHSIIIDLMACQPFTVDDILRRFRRQEAEKVKFFSFARDLCDRLSATERLRTSERYRTVINSFRRFMKEVDPPVCEIDSDMMQSYEAYLSRRGNCRNTISFYMRGLRAIYNHAVDRKITPQNHPFRNVYTGICKTVKRALPLDFISKIKGADLSGKPQLSLARDIFMFSFYMRGMSFVDMAYLRKSDINHGQLIYQRHKTGQQLFIKWEPYMQEIVDKYRDDNSPYLLPIIKDQTLSAHRQYKTKAHLINEHLKKLGQLLDLPIPLTAYVARHSWASIASNQNISISTISAAMGHDSEKTTRIYLKAFNNNAIDEANTLIFSKL